jgi:hypothetical protein
MNSVLLRSAVPKMKVLHFLRHGQESACFPFIDFLMTLTINHVFQAQHNPRAEAARTAGCSHEKFLDLMREDDQFDADLTELGRAQVQC